MNWVLIKVVWTPELVQFPVSHDAFQDLAECTKGRQDISSVSVTKDMNNFNVFFCYLVFYL